MKSTGKSSPNRQSDDTLIYIFLLFLVAAIVAVAVYYFAGGGNSNQQTVDNIDYEEALGARKEEPKPGDISKLLIDNKSRVKTVRRGLNSVNKNLSPKQREEIERELKEDEQLHLIDIAKNVDFSKWTQEEINSFYALLYEQGKTLVRLKAKVSGNKSYQELRKQWLITQRNWEIPPHELKEIDARLKKLIATWYNRFMDNKLFPENGEVRDWEYLRPVLIKGQKVDPDSPANISYFKKVHELVDKDGSKKIVDLRAPVVRVDFQGYDGFLTPEDEKGSSEGSTTLGITLTKDEIMNWGWEAQENGQVLGENRCLFLENNYRPIKIRLKKILFFNREGYDEWINGVSQKDQKTSHNYFDISWDQVVETIAHELAHAVINSLQPNKSQKLNEYGSSYWGERGGGHGELHDNFQKRIEGMMKESSEFQEFETWWKRGKKNG
jgi:hypothetical protein